MTAVELDEIVQSVQAMDRAQLLGKLLHTPANFPVDLTLEFLNRQSDDRLRHLLVALYLHCDHIPQAVAA